MSHARFRPRAPGAGLRRLQAQQSETAPHKELTPARQKEPRQEDSLTEEPHQEVTLASQAEPHKEVTLACQEEPQKETKEELTQPQVFPQKGDRQTQGKCKEPAGSVGRPSVVQP